MYFRGKDCSENSSLLVMSDECSNLRFCKTLLLMEKDIDCCAGAVWWHILVTKSVKNQLELFYLFPISSLLNAVL